MTRLDDATLEQMTDQLETWLAAHRIHPNQYTLKSFRESLRVVSSEALGPTIAEIQQRLASLDESELKMVWWELRNPMRARDRITH